MEKTKLVSEEKFIKENKNKDKDEDSIKKEIEKEIKIQESGSEKELNSEDEDAENKNLKKETKDVFMINLEEENCLLYTSPSPRDLSTSRMPSSA